MIKILWCILPCKLVHLFKIDLSIESYIENLLTKGVFKYAHSYNIYIKIVHSNELESNMLDDILN